MSRTPFNPRRANRLVRARLEATRLLAGIGAALAAAAATGQYVTGRLTSLLGITAVAAAAVLAWASLRAHRRYRWTQHPHRWDAIQQRRQQRAARRAEKNPAGEATEPAPIEELARS